jgi:hypothetical protein
MLLPHTVSFPPLHLLHFPVTRDQFHSPAICMCGERSLTPRLSSSIPISLHTLLSLATAPKWFVLEAEMTEKMQPRRVKERTGFDTILPSVDVMPTVISDLSRQYKDGLPSVRKALLEDNRASRGRKEHIQLRNTVVVRDHKEWGSLGYQSGSRPYNDFDTKLFC